MRKQMNIDRTEAYVEVLEVLNHMDKKYVEKIPEKVIEFLKNNSSKEYQFNWDNNKSFEEQKFKDTTINILAMLNLNYWCENEKHKKELMKKYYDNEVKYQQELSKKYSTDNLFKKEKNVISVPVQETINNFPEYYEEEQKWYEKLYDSVHEIISKFIRRLFR